MSENYYDNHKNWMKEAKEKKATHFLDIIDTFNYEHYPIYIFENDVLQDKIDEYNNKDMQRVYEIVEVKED